MNKPVFPNHGATKFDDLLTQLERDSLELTRIIPAISDSTLQNSRMDIISTRLKGALENLQRRHEQ